MKVGEFGEVRPMLREWTTNPLRMARRTDVLLCVVGATCGKVNLGEDCAIGRSVAAIRPNPSKLDQFYLYYFMMTLIERLRSGSVGAAQTVISKEMVEAVQIPLPPLSEQQKIVGILDRAFAGLGAALANSKRNLKNTRALFESKLESVFARRGDGWVHTTVGDLVDLGVLESPLDGNHGEIHPKKADFVSSGVPFIMASDLRGGLVDQEGCAFITRKQADSLRKGFARDGDILLSHKGTIGRVAFLHTDHNYVMLTPQVTYYRICRPDTLLNRFLYFGLQAPDFVRMMNELAQAGSTRAYIGITKQRELPIAYPDIHEQRRIADGLIALATETTRLGHIYERKLAALQELKQSLLHDAFNPRGLLAAA